MIEFPIFIFYTQFLFHESSAIDFTLVIDGPRARWAPEQFMQINTPKSNEAPINISQYITTGCLAITV